MLFYDLVRPRQHVGRVALLWSSPVESRQLTEAQNAAKALGLTLQSLDVRQLDDFDRVFEAAKKEGAHAFAVAPSPIINNQRTRVVDFAVESRLPAIYPLSEFMEVGGLMSYAPNTADLYRRAAGYVDKIFKGIKPADLPVERPATLSSS